MAEIQGIAPVLVVRDLKRAADHYEGVLGFEVEGVFEGPARFCIAERDGLALMLVEREPHASSPWSAYVWVDDVDALFEELTTSGAEIVHPPEDRPAYDNRELAVRDIDGHVIAFGSELEG
jgi:uncharacterized glyoxalase superfamily protein PhnB